MAANTIARVGNSSIGIDGNSVYISNTLVVGSIQIGNCVITPNSPFFYADYANMVDVNDLKNYVSISNVASANLVVNNTAYFGGHPPGFYANVTSPVFSTSVNVGSNVSLNTTSLSVLSNSSNVVINSSGIFVSNTTANVAVTPKGIDGNIWLTANDSSYLGGLPANVYVNSSVAFFQNSISVGANVVLNTSSMAVGPLTINSCGIFIGNTVVNSSFFSSIANNTLNFGGHPPGYYANVTNPYFSNSITIGTTGTHVYINTTSIVIGNSTVNAIINATSFSLANTGGSMDGGDF